MAGPRRAGNTRRAAGPLTAARRTLPGGSSETSEETPAFRPGRNRTPAEQDKESRFAAKAERRDALSRGRYASTPSAIPPRGWNDILWRVYERLGEDRIRFYHRQDEGFAGRKPLDPRDLGPGDALQ